MIERKKAPTGQSSFVISFRDFLGFWWITWHRSITVSRNRYWIEFEWVYIKRKVTRTRNPTACLICLSSSQAEPVYCTQQIEVKIWTNGKSKRSEVVAWYSPPLSRRHTTVLVQPNLSLRTLRCWMNNTHDATTDCSNDHRSSPSKSLNSAVWHAMQMGERERGITCWIIEHWWMKKFEWKLYGPRKEAPVKPDFVRLRS